MDLNEKIASRRKEIEIEKAKEKKEKRDIEAKKNKETLQRAGSNISKAIFPANNLIVSRIYLGAFVGVCLATLISVFAGGVSVGAFVFILPATIWFSFQDRAGITMLRLLLVFNMVVFYLFIAFMYSFSVRAGESEGDEIMFIISAGIIPIIISTFLYWYIGNLDKSKK